MLRTGAQVRAGGGKSGTIPNAVRNKYQALLFLYFLAIKCNMYYKRLENNCFKASEYRKGRPPQGSFLINMPRLKASD